MSNLFGLAFRLLFIAFLMLDLASCATAIQASQVHPEESLEAEVLIPEVQAMPERIEKPGEIAFIPAYEDLSPLKTKSISISARNTPLRDVLYTIAESSYLNVVIEKGVDPEIPITITLKNMNLEEVLDTVLSSVDYFYAVKNNILIIKVLETRIFEFGQPSILQDYSITVGGDMLGGAKTGSAGVSGNITQNIVADKDSFKFWDSIEKSIAGLLAVQADSENAQSQPGPSFSIHRMTGTIVVTASKKDLARVENYINTLKKILKRQVLVEARIIEIQLSDSLKYGIDWSFLGSGGKGMPIVSAGTDGFTNSLNSLPNFNFTLTGGDFTSLLRALQQQGNINVLSNPRVNIMNGQTAFLSVGRKVDFISKVETTSTGSTTTVPTVTYTVETSSVLSGIMFGIVPFINAAEDDHITMNISPIITDLVNLESKTLGVTGSDAIELSLPTIDLRELSTTVQVRNGQMVIIGGLMQNKERLQDNNVPFLAHIPLLGYLFKNREKSSEKTELIIMLKPLIMSEPI